MSNTQVRSPELLSSPSAPSTQEYDVIGIVIKTIAWLQRKLRRRNGVRQPHEGNGVLSEGLKSLGFTSFTQFADLYPKASLSELAVKLGGPPERDWVVHTRLLMEAERRNTVDQFARSMFIRFLHQGPHPENNIEIFAPTGTVELALYRVALTLPTKHRAACLRVALGHLRADVGFNWKPDSTMDIALVELFCNYWPETSVTFFPIVRLMQPTEQQLPRLVLDEREGDDEGEGNRQDETTPPWAA
jgi:hypothetical protein